MVKKRLYLGRLKEQNWNGESPRSKWPSEAVLLTHLERQGEDTEDTRASGSWRPERGDAPERGYHRAARPEAQSPGWGNSEESGPLSLPLQSPAHVPLVLRPHPCQLGSISPALPHLSLGTTLPGVVPSILNKRKLWLNDSFTPPMFVLWIIQLH